MPRPRAGKPPLGGVAELLDRPGRPVFGLRRRRRGNLGEWALFRAAAMGCSSPAWSGSGRRLAGVLQNRSCARVQCRLGSVGPVRASAAAVGGLGSLLGGRARTRSSRYVVDKSRMTAPTHLAPHNIHSSKGHRHSSSTSPSIRCSTVSLALHNPVHPCAARLASEDQDRTNVEHQLNSLLVCGVSPYARELHRPTIPK